MVPSLNLYKDYTRQDVHDIFSPETRFTPGSGTWGLQGIVENPNKRGDFVFFVTFGQRQADHTFDEWITESGVFSWQSQPSQTFQDRRIQQFIGHDENQNSIYLFLRTQRAANYTYLGKLKYLSHDPDHEKPVFLYWKLMDWPIPVPILNQINLKLYPDSAYNNEIAEMSETYSEYGQTKTSFDWRGRTWQVSRQELLEKVRGWIKSGLPIEATRFTNWAIDIDNNRISPKWLFHLITGAGYHEFDSSQARDKLSQIGFVATSIDSMPDSIEDFLDKNVFIWFGGKPTDRAAFFQSIEKMMKDEFPDTFQKSEFRFPNRVNWFEVRFPDLVGLYSFRLARQFDEYAYYFNGNTQEAKVLVQHLEPLIQGLSEQIGYPLSASANYSKTWGRFGFEISHGLKTCDIQYKEKTYEDITAHLFGVFIQITHELLINFMPRRRKSRTQKRSDVAGKTSPEYQSLLAKLETIKQVLSGNFVSPGDEVLCDWVHFCYDFGLYKEGQMLFTLVAPDQVNPWYYERTKKFARLCSIKLAAKD